MDLPLEILTEIASNLSGADLKAFRVVCSPFADAGIAVLARGGISALDTSVCLGRLLRDLRTCEPLSRGTKSLTIYHGQWPVCSRDEWETHPLLFGGNDRHRLRGTVDVPGDGPFTDYSHFVSEEQERTLPDDVDKFSRLLSLLPTLRTMVISHMKTLTWHPSRSAKYRDLLEKIWMAPFADGCVTLAVDAFLLALGRKVATVRQLVIDGTLDPAELNISPAVKYPMIYNLHIGTLRVHEKSGALAGFLSSFPNLVDLRVAFGGWESSIPDVIGRLSWSYLRALRLDDLWASEDTIFHLFQRHQSTLEEFSLGNATITQGSWKFLFTRIRGLRARAHVSVDGELYGRRSRDTVRMDLDAAKRFASFMKEANAPWPF